MQEVSKRFKELRKMGWLREKKGSWMKGERKERRGGVKAK